MGSTPVGLSRPGFIRTVAANLGDEFEIESNVEHCCRSVRKTGIRKINETGLATGVLKNY
jgi:hypothetical protein